jgi:endonuclease/exonuclease/phosphatase (EEP) superfamily protein YafD
LGSVILWQELGNHESQSIMHQEFPDSAWYHLPARDKVPTRMSVKRSLWTVEQSASYLMHPRYPGVRGQRETYVTVALLTLTGTGIQFLVTNSHYTPHAWCAHNVPGKQWRKDKWNLHHAKHGDLVLDARSKGITVIGGGDFNNPAPAKFNVDQVWFRQARLDYLWGLHSAGGATFTKQSDQSVSLNSDHNALVTQLSWTAGSNSLKSGYNWPGL